MNSCIRVSTDRYHSKNKKKCQDRLTQLLLGREEKRSSRKPEDISEPEKMSGQSQKTLMKKRFHIPTGIEKPKKEISGLYGSKGSTPEHVSTECQYSEFMGLIHKNEIAINRKVLADLAMNHPMTFKAVVDKVKPKK